MTTRFDLIAHLRDHIVGALHVGHLHAGDRLPSIREMAARVSHNERTVRAAYRALEEQGLVVIKGRSGVFVAKQDEVGVRQTVPDVARWLSEVISEGWTRRIMLAELAPLITRCTTNRLRCGLIELVEDGRVAFGHELRTDFGFDVRVLAPDDVARNQDVDLFATTSFYAPLVRSAIAALGKPLVVLTVHPALDEAVRRRLRAGILTVIAVDTALAERIRISHDIDPHDDERIRMVQAENHDAIANLDPKEPVLLTRAASEKLRTWHVPLVFPFSPTISPESARALANILVRKNLAIA